MANNEKKVLGFIFAILVIFGAYMGYDYLNEDVVEVDDIVEFNYIAWLQDDGTVFATSIVNEYNITKETALDDSHRYHPVAVTIGLGEASKGTIKAIEGLDEGLRGMKVGDIEEIVIPPEKGYEPDPELVIEIDRSLDILSKQQTTELYQYVNRSVTLTKSQYYEQFGKDAEVGDIVNLVNWYGIVMDVSQDTVYILGNPEVGTIIQSLPWNLEIVELTSDTIKLMFKAEIEGIYQNAYGNIRVDDIVDDEIYFYQVSLNDDIETIYGMAEIVDMGESFEIIINPEEGKIINTENGYAIIKDIQETTFKLDYNPIYVGRTIVYKVKIEKIIKAEK